MTQHSRSSLFKVSSGKLASLLAALALAACVEPSIRNVTAPDGLPALFVQCAGDEGACFELAGQSCPRGYDIRPAISGRVGSYLVRCTYGPPPVYAAYAPPPPAPSPGPAQDRFVPPPAAAPTSSVPTATFPGSGPTPSTGQAPKSTSPSSSDQGWPPPEPGPTALPWEDLDLGY